MKLALDADVAPEIVQNAWSLFCLASVDERPLNDLEMLGWLVLGHNIAAVLTLRPPDRATRPAAKVTPSTRPAGDANR